MDATDEVPAVRAVRTRAEAANRVQDITNGAFLAALLGAAVEHGLPERLDQAKTPGALASDTQVDPVELDVLLRGLLLVGLVERVGEAYRAEPGLRALADDEGGLRDLLRMELALAHRAYDAARTVPEARSWEVADDDVLESLGAMSARIVPYLTDEIIPRLGDVQQRLESGEGVFLDVGAGVGAVTAAMCVRYPELRAVALEPAEAPHRLARRRFAHAGLDARVQLRLEGVESLDLVDAVDLVWVAGDFLLQDLLPPAFAALHRAVRPGGWVSIGSMDHPTDEVATIVGALHTIAAGGGLPGAANTASHLRDAGFVEVRQDPACRTGSCPSWPAAAEGLLPAPRDHQRVRELRRREPVTTSPGVKGAVERRGASSWPARAPTSPVVSPLAWATW